MPGHPDGQSYAVWRGTPLFASASAPISNGNPIIVTGLITNFASIRIRASTSPANGMTINCQYFTDPTLTVPVGGYSWGVPNGMSLDVLAPALGNFVQVTVSTTTVAVFDIALAVLGMNVGVSAPTYPFANNDVSATTVSVAASSSVIVPLLFVMAGRAHFWWRDITSSGKLSFFINALALNGVPGVGITTNAAPVTQVSGDFTIDATPLCVNISNSDTVAHSAGYFLSIDGR